MLRQADGFLGFQRNSRASPRCAPNGEQQKRYGASPFASGENVFTLRAIEQRPERALRCRTEAMKRAAICIVPDRAHAEIIITELQSAGVRNDDISVIFPHDEDTKGFAQNQLGIKEPETVMMGVGAGGFIGGTLGLLAGVGALAIPGIGPLIAVGPLVALITGAMTGAALGAVTTSLLTIGVPEHQAKHYEGRIKNGGLLISVHSEAAEEVARAHAIFEHAGAEDISSTTAPHQGLGASGPE